MILNKDNIEFSFDDWYPDDLKYAHFLHENWYKNVTFYIPISNTEWKKTLSSNQIKEIAGLYQIWWHTYNHIDLTTIDLLKAEKEILDWKKAIEDIIGRHINSFCPPRGHYNDEILDLIRQAWFDDCRSARLLNFNKLDKNEFLWHPNLHFYNHSFLVDVLHCLRQKDLFSIKNRISNSHLKHLELIKSIIELNGKIHIWWHSWEIDFEEFKKMILFLN